MAKPQPLYLEHVIRRAARTGMTDGTCMVIEYISGFEQFGTYETWGQGYRVHGYGVIVEARDLESAVNEWASAVEKKRSGEPIPPHRDLTKWKRDGEPYRAAMVLDLT